MYKKGHSFNSKQSDLIFHRFEIEEQSHDSPRVFVKSGEQRLPGLQGTSSIISEKNIESGDSKTKIIGGITNCSRNEEQH